MAAAFHEVLFPLDVSLRGRGGPQRRTEIVITGSGREERNQRWAHARRRYEAGYGIRGLAALHEVLAFERGDRVLEQRRHAEFASLRIPGTEWFETDAALLAHVDAVRAGVRDPWALLARWRSEAAALRT